MLDTNTDLSKLLNDSDLLATKAYLAGEWRDADSGATFAVRNPARGDVIADVRTSPAPRRPERSMPLTAPRRNGLLGPVRSAPRCCADGTS